MILCKWHSTRIEPYIYYFRSSLIYFSIPFKIYGIYKWFMKINIFNIFYRYFLSMQSTNPSLSSSILPTANVSPSSLTQIGSGVAQKRSLEKPSLILLKPVFSESSGTNLLRIPVDSFIKFNHSVGNRSSSYKPGFSCIIYNRHIIVPPAEGI
jgi:hypothetical protein